MKRKIAEWAEKVLRKNGFENRKTIIAFRIAEFFGC